MSGEAGSGKRDQRKWSLEWNERPTSQQELAIWQPACPTREFKSQYLCCDKEALKAACHRSRVIEVKTMKQDLLIGYGTDGTYR